MKVIIVGGGIGGLTAALSLHQAGVDVQVFEKADEFRELACRHQSFATCDKATRTGTIPAISKKHFRSFSLIKGSGSPARMGDQLFSDGLKYGAVARDIEHAMLFFEGSRLAYELGHKLPLKKSPDHTCTTR
jgi:2-polyprenyl-6-methoxyphenol hydroxylase-like FAD-dependent oxidoreductase